MEGVFIAHWHLITFEKGGKEQLPEGSGFIFIFFVSSVFNFDVIKIFQMRLVTQLLLLI